MSGSSTFAVASCTFASTARLVLSGELDLDTAHELEESVERVCARHIRRIEIDLGKLSFIDAAGARSISAARSRLAGICDVVIRGARPMAAMVLSFFDLYDCSLDKDPGRTYRPERPTLTGRPAASAVRASA